MSAAGLLKPTPREDRHHPEPIVIPRPVVILVVVVLLAVLCADVGGQYVIAGHQASPIIDGAIVALIGAIVTGTKGPRPEGSPDTAPVPTGVEATRPGTTPLPVVEPERPRAGRHHRRADEGHP